VGSLLFFWSSDYFRHFRHYTEYTVIKIAYINWPFRSAWVHCVTLYIIICPFVRFFLSIVLSVRLRYTDSDYLFGIFCPLCCLFVFDIRILITSLKSLASWSSTTRVHCLTWLLFLIVDRNIHVWKCYASHRTGWFEQSIR
jgi:hypothetical protein